MITTCFPQLVSLLILARPAKPVGKITKMNVRRQKYGLGVTYVTPGITFHARAYATHQKKNCIDVSSSLIGYAIIFNFYQIPSTTGGVDLG